MKTELETKNKSPLFKEYSVFVLATILLVLVAVVTFTYFTYRANNQNHITILEREAKNINNVIAESFDYSNRINSYIGQQIADHGEKDLKFILNLFQNAEKIQNKNSQLLSWTSFDWVNANNLQTVNSRLGIRKNPPNMSTRQYTISSPQKPWSLQVSFPTLGNPSGIWVIPAGTGVVDNKNKFLGTVVVGFDVDEFGGKIQQKLGNNNVNFVVLDNDSNIILQSSANGLKPDDDFYKKNNVNQKFNQKSGKLDNALLVNGIKYSYYKKIENYPYVVLTGFHCEFLTKEFVDLIFPHILEFIIITVFFLFVLYLFKNRIEYLLILEKQLRSALDKANRHLQALNKSINHDLRNYISGILGVAQIIADESVVETQDFASPNAKETQDVAKETQDVASLQQINQNSKLIIDQAKIMLKFSNSLITDEGIERKLKLQMANRKLGEETEEDDFEDIDIDALINQLILLKRPFTKEQEVSVKIDITESLPILRTNLIEIRKILDNLITNAIKYSPKGSEVVIKAAIVENQIEIEIIDNGIGMSPEDIEKALSGEGKSIDKSGIDKPIDSHGIGFPIVKQAVENLDAVMEIKSEKGKGTKIAVRFKIGKKQIVADRGGELHSPLQPTQSTSTTPSSSSSINSSLNGKTILIADDEALILMATERQLMRLGCNVLTAKSGDEVITILDNNHCDVVLMDCNMTKVNDGLATTKLIREGSIFKNFKNYKTIPIIAFSANTDQKSQDAALQSGMNGYLEKPFDKEMFAKIVNGFQN